MVTFLLLLNLVLICLLASYWSAVRNRYLQMQAQRKKVLWGIFGALLASALLIFILL